MKRIILPLLILSILTSVSAFGDDQAGEEKSPDLENSVTMAEEGYAFPVIKPDISVFGGYRFVDLSGSPRAEEFEYLHDSIMLGGELRIFSFPHRFHLDLDIKNRKDYFGDLSYAFEDMVLFRGINRTLFHNLDNITLVDLDPATATPGVDVRDNGEHYGVKVGISTVFLRLKAHDFPLHFYIDGLLIEKDGRRQQRSLLGSASFNDIVRTSQVRDVDWKTKNLVFGTNSHLGPVEIDIAHSEKRFDPGRENVIFDEYTAVGDPLGSTRIAGVYPHNFIPELKESSNTLKLHTSYTGRIVASATFSKIDKENEDSNAEADYFVGAGEVAWTASPNLAVFLKYRHREADMDTPSTVSIENVCNPANNIAGSYECIIKPAISTKTDIASGTIRYRPVSGVTLWGEYSYDEVRRDDAEEWKLPDSTQRNIASLSASFRVVRGLHLKTKYTHKDINNPAYNIDPDRSDEGRISVTWLPLAQLSTLVSYTAAEEKRKDLRFVETNDTITAGEKRKVNRDMFLGSATYVLMNNLSATASFAYIHHKTQQDIEYHDTSGNPHIDPFVPFKNMAHTYALNLNYLPESRVNLAAGVSHTVSRGTFYPSSIDLLEPISIASFSEVKIKETVYSVSGGYRFKNGFGFGVDYRYADFNDVLDNPYDDIKDGQAHIVLLSLSKKW